MHGPGMLLKGSVRPDSTTSAGVAAWPRVLHREDAAAEHRSSTRSRRFMWLCCAAPPHTLDDSSEDSSLEFHAATVDAAANRLRPSLLTAKPPHEDHAAAPDATDPTSVPVQGAQGTQTHIQQLVVVSAGSSPKPAVTPIIMSDPSTLWKLHDQQQQQQHAALTGHYSRLSIDVHTLVSGRSPSTAAAVDTVLPPAGASSCSNTPVLLTADSLSHATAASMMFESFTMAGQGAARPMAARLHLGNTKDSPSEIHSDLQQDVKAMASTTAGSSSSTISCVDHQHVQQQPCHAQRQRESSNSSCSQPDQPAQPWEGLTTTSSASIPLQQQRHQPQQQQQQQQQQVVKRSAVHFAPSTQDANQQRSSTASRLSPVHQQGEDSAHTMITSSSWPSVAGWTDSVHHPHTAAAAAAVALEAASTAHAAASAQAVAMDRAASAPTSLAGGPAVSPKPPGSPTDDGSSVPSPALACKLRKLESGFSFRMLQPELSDSFRASDSYPTDSTAAVSECLTAAPASDSDRSDPSSAPVSHRSTAGLGPAVLPASTQSPAESPAGEELLPAAIPEHVGITCACGSVLPTSAAVAAAFQADAAAVQDLVEAAAAVLPAAKPNHSRSKSDGTLMSVPVPPAAAAATGAAAGGESCPPQGVAENSSAPDYAEQPASTADTNPSADAALTAVAAAAAAASSSRPPPSSKPVNRTLSVSSSPFAQVDLQQLVTASLLSPQPAVQSSQGHSSGPPAAAPAEASDVASSFAGGSSAATPSSVAHTAGATHMADYRRTSSSSSFRSMPIGLSAQQLQQQQQASQLQLGVAGSSSSIRPVLTSRLSWASAVTVIEPPSHVFSLLDQSSVTEDAAAAERASSARPLRPSKSLSSLASLKRAVGSAGGSSSSGSSSSGGKAPGRRIPPTGIFGLQRARSAAALLRRFKSTHHPALSHNAAAATATEAVAAARKQSSSSSSTTSSSNSDGRVLVPAASAPAGPSPVKSILRRPSSSSLFSRQSSRPSNADVLLVTGTTATLQMPLSPPQQATLASPGGIRRHNGVAVAAVGPSSALPPLPRPASSLSLDAATAAAAGTASPAAVLAPALSSSTASLAQSMMSNGPCAVHSGGNLLPSGSSTAQQPLAQLPSTTSAPPLRETRSVSASSIGQLSSSGSSSGTGGSLMSLAITRLHSAAASSSGSIGAAASSSQFPTLPQAGSRTASLPSINSDNLASSADVARSFAEAFIAAVTTGNTRWASEEAVAQLLHDSTKMVGLDKQLYVGKTAIIRRLNGGMEQLVKMAQATVGGSSSSNSGDESAAAVNSMATMTSKLPKPQLTVVCPDPKGKPSQAEVVYIFKWGLRKFTMKDEVIAKGGQILRLRRTRG